MKKIGAILVGMILLFSCSNESDPTVVNKKDKEQGEDGKDKMNDSVLLIPLNELYTERTIEYIKQKKYVPASNHLVMGFFVKDGKIIIGSNEKRGLFSFDPSNSKLVELTKSKLPLIIEEDAMSSLAVVGNELYASTYFDSYLFDMNNWILKKQMGESFDKRSIDFVRVMNKNVLSGFVEINPLLKQSLSEYFMSPGYDQSCTNKDNHIIVLANQTENHVLLLKCKSSGEMKPLKLTFNKEDMSIYDDVDIISLSKGEIKFVLKTSFPEKYSDVLVTFDLINEIVKKTRSLKTLFREATFYGDPVAFPTGSTYFYDKNRLWRMRNTGKGLCFENWKNIK